MSMLDSINRSILRLNGLSTGLDTDSIVARLLQVDKFKVDKQYKLTTKLEWKAEALRSVNQQLKTFRQTNMSVLAPETNMLSSAAYRTFRVTMLDETSAVTVSAGSNATAGRLTIQSIDQLAAAADVRSSDVFASPISLSTALKDLEFATPLTFDENGQISFSINGEVFSFDENSTLSDVLGQVNARSAAGVTMSYSSLRKGFVLTSKTTGSSSQIVLENLSGNAFAAGSAAFGIEAGTYTGRDAVLTIEGTTVTQSTNSFTIDGITYTLRHETAAPVSFQVERDIDKTYDRIVAFINNYNALVDSLQNKIDEPVYSDYGPLTDEEREQLTETQQTKWEEKAKSGLLRRDSNITRLIDQMRSAFFTAVAGVGKSPADIGLTTSSYHDGAKITIDESKLRKALESDPDAVAAIFTKTSSATDPAVRRQESGLMVRLSEAINQYTSMTIDVSLVQTDKAIADAKARLSELEEWLADQEEAYWAKFTAMETAIAKLNSQSSWLAGQLGTYAQKQ